MFKFIYFPILLIFFLSGCSADYKKLSNGNYSSDDSFYNTLILEYKKQADFEAKEMHDWNSAKLYSIKAIKSSEGKIIKPEKIAIATRLYIFIFIMGKLQPIVVHCS